MVGRMICMVGRNKVWPPSGSQTLERVGFPNIEIGQFCPACGLVGCSARMQEGWHAWTTAHAWATGLLADGLPALKLLSQ